MIKKRLPIGVSDFKKIIEENYYYVDKTNFIKEILEKKSEVTLLARPRRFGKTLNMTTLKYFLDIKESLENRKLFSGLNIEKSDYIVEQGKYPVIYLTMKDLGGRNFTEFYEEFKSKVSGIFNEYENIREKLNARDLKEFDKIWSKEENGDYSRALNFLSELIFKCYKIKPVLLIDEYDAPMIKANEMGYYDDVKELIGTFYGSALKDGVAAFSVITGILRVAKESIFSTLNNLKVSRILSEDYSHFGMLELEVEEILKYYNLETTLNDTKKWYNGYLFGKEKVYNPWSILNHCDTGKLEGYWVNTSANTLIKMMLENADEQITDIFYELLRDGKVKTILNENVIFGQKYSNDTILYLMFSAGYLTIDSIGKKDDEYYLKIPNYEVKKYFKNTFVDIVKGNGINSFSELEDALLEGKIRGVKSIDELINTMFLSSMSYLDSSKEEKFYHNLVLGMLIGLDNHFYIHSNREVGIGRYDLALEPKDKKGYGYIFEFKVSKKNDDMEKMGAQALDQIERKIYEHEMRSRGISKIIKIGMVFCGKTLKLYEKL